MCTQEPVCQSHFFFFFWRADKKWMPSLCAHVISYWLNILHGINQEIPLRSKTEMQMQTGKWQTGLKPPLFVCLVFLLSCSGTFLLVTSGAGRSSFLCLSFPSPSVKSTQSPQALLSASVHRWLRWTGKSWPLSCHSSSLPPPFLFLFLILSQMTGTRNITLGRRGKLYGDS